MFLTKGRTKNKAAKINLCLWKIHMWKVLKRFEGLKVKNYSHINITIKYKIAV